MLAQLMCLLALIAIAIAMPLNSKAMSSSTASKRCKGTLALLEGEDDDNAITMNTDGKFTMTRSKVGPCETEEVQPAVRLSSFPNTGITWLQYLLEEATKVATQNPQSIVDSSGGPFLYPDEQVNCRAECGAQIFKHADCIAGSVDANNVTLASGMNPEVFKNHYPDLTRPGALFETYEAIQKTILLTRNPLDSYLASLRHVAAEDAEKVPGINLLTDSPTDSLYDTPPDVDLESCPPGFAPLRNETAGRGIDPLYISPGPPRIYTTFEEFLPIWCEFFNFWLEHSSVNCTEITVVRYEDLATITGDVLETIMDAAGLSPWLADGISRAVAAFPVSTSRLSYDVYFNETLHTNHTMKKWADIAAGGCGNRVDDFGYTPFFQKILSTNINP